MKISLLLAVSLLFFSCKKSNESVIKLLRTEATDYNGVLLTTEYVYDSGDRIIAIKQAENSAIPVVTVTVTYNGNEITMLSYPKNDPIYNTTKEVRLTVDANGKPLKKIGYTYAVGSFSYNSLSKKFMYDTSLYKYDAAGFLKEIKQGLYDSSWAGPGNTIAARSNATVAYTIVAGNVTAKDEYAVYTRTITNAGTPNLTGGTSEYQTIYKYTKLYPNKTDFTNATVLNEFRNYNELLLDGLYKNMPEQLAMHTVDRDLNGTVYFNYSSTEEIERVYNDNGLLSAVNILTPTSQYRKYRYFYSR